MTVDFLSFDTEVPTLLPSGPLATSADRGLYQQANWDFLYLDGTEFSGSSSPGTFSSPASSVEIRFTSDGSVGADGFAASAECPGPAPPPPPPPPPAPPALSGSPCDGVGQTIPGGGTITFTGGYNSGQDCLWMVECPAPPITLTFASFETEGGYDFVYIDGTEYHVRHAEPHSQYSILTM